jgi:hypothetical protein
MRLLKLPTLFSTVTMEEVERAENLNIPLEAEVEKDFIYVNPEYVISANRNAEGDATMLAVAGRESTLLVSMDLEEFLLLLDSYENLT